MRYNITSYQLCLRLRMSGFSIDTYSYYFNKSKNVILSADVVPPKDFLKHYTPAYSTSELLSIAPVNTVISKTDRNEFTASFKDNLCTDKTAADALAQLLLLLKKKGVIK